MFALQPTQLPCGGTLILLWVLLRITLRLIPGQACADGQRSVLILLLFTASWLQSPPKANSSFVPLSACNAFPEADAKHCPRRGTATATAAPVPPRRGRGHSRPRQPHFRHGGGAGLGCHGGAGGAVAVVDVGAGRPDEVPFPWTLGPLHPPSGAQNVPAAPQGMVAAGVGPAARSGGTDPSEASSLPSSRGSRCSAPPCPGRALPRPPGGPARPAGSLLRWASSFSEPGPTESGPSEGQIFLSESCVKVGTRGAIWCLWEGFHPACPAVTQRRRLSVH